ncbi:phosphoribulokinase [soil metagenome]
MSAQPFLLGVVGDSGSGKNTVADAVAELLGSDRISNLRLDDYHRYSREERAELGLTALNPLVHNFALMQEHLLMLREGQTVRNRSYDHADGTFGPIRQLEPRDVVLVRGLLGYPNETIRDLYNLTVFLDPEPDLLFRWKLRRDVLSRGYREAEVLKSIASHLLDSKEFVNPQAQRADIVVRYELPHWEAPDSEVVTSITLRREAAKVTRGHRLFASLGGVRQQDTGAEVMLRLDKSIAEEDVERTGREIFPDTFQSELAGLYVAEAGELRRRPALALVELLIARLAVLMRNDDVASTAA